MSWRLGTGTSKAVTPQGRRSGWDALSFPPAGKAWPWSRAHSEHGVPTRAVPSKPVSSIGEAHGSQGSLESRCHAGSESGGTDGKWQCQ